VRLTIGSAAAFGGGVVTIPVSLTGGGSGGLVAGVQNDIGFEPDVAIGAQQNGRPDCTANPAIDKRQTVFSFLPPGCTPGADCNAVRAIVLSLQNVDPIPVGSTLYTCNVTVADDAFGTTNEYPLTCSNAHASDPIGNLLATECIARMVWIGAIP
jgi:hypothetical protein